jgi:hypothetical protein
MDDECHWRWQSSLCGSRYTNWAFREPTIDDDQQCAAVINRKNILSHLLSNNSHFNQLFHNITNGTWISRDCGDSDDGNAFLHCLCEYNEHGSNTGWNYNATCTEDYNFLGIHISRSTYDSVITFLITSMITTSILIVLLMMYAGYSYCKYYYTNDTGTRRSTSILDAGDMKSNSGDFELERFVEEEYEFRDNSGYVRVSQEL